MKKKKKCDCELHVKRGGDKIPCVCDCHFNITKVRKDEERKTEL